MADNHIERKNVQFLGDVRFLQLPHVFTSRLTATSSPSVKNCQVFECSGAIVTVTNFLGGMGGQTIKLLGDGKTTIDNNVYIKTNTGAAKLLAANIMYTFTLLNDVWYEDE